MVGYGAGAWQMALLERAGLGAPKGNAGWSHCIPETTDPDPENNDDPNPEMEANPSQDDSQDAPDNENPFAGLDTPESDSDDNVSGPNSSQDVNDPFATDSEATFCSASPTDGAPGLWTLFFFLLCLTRRFRQGARHD